MMQIGQRHLLSLAKIQNIILILNICKYSVGYLFIFILEIRKDFFFLEKSQIYQLHTPGMSYSNRTSYIQNFTA